MLAGGIGKPRILNPNNSSNREGGSSLLHMAEERPEPEIIPPGKPGGEAAKVRFFVAQPSPFATVLVVLITGLLLALLFIMLAGALLFVLPTLILLVIAFIVGGLLQIYFGRPR